MKKIVIALLSIVFLFPSSINGQDLIPENGELFKNNVVPIIDIIIDQNELDAIFENVWSNDMHPATFIFDNGFVKDTVENIGFRLRGNTSRSSAKKSFKVSFNTYEAGRKYRSVEKLNINGEHNDPTISRSKVGWDLLRNIEVPAPRCNHVELYINAEYYGIYANVEHIDEEFVDKRFGNKDGNLYKCLWPATLDYINSDPNSYKIESNGRRSYALKTNTEADNYEDIAEFISVLNNTAIDDLPCELEKVFNVDQYLKVIAFDILIGNWDGPIYNKNNFYIYKNTATNQFEYIPYDLDNTLGIDFFNINWATRNIYNWAASNEPRPIYTRLMQSTTYRTRFSYYMNQILQEHFNTDLFEYFDDLKNLIRSSADDDPLRPQDYGWDITDFENAYDTGIGFPAEYGLKSFVSARRNAALQQLVLTDIIPIITDLKVERLNEQQDLLFSTRVEDDNGINGVVLKYKIGSGGTEMEQQLSDDNGDGIYETTLNTTGINNIIYYYVEAEDNQTQSNRNPVCDFETIAVGNSDSPLVINEYMASNNMAFADEEGEFDDWIEIYNANNNPIFMGDKYLTDKINQPTKWQFPDVTIPANGYLIVWADEDGSQGELHANFRLSASGETIALYDSEENNFGLIDVVSYTNAETDIAYGRLPNGSGAFQATEQSPGQNNELLDGVGEITPIGFKVFPNPFSSYIEVVIEDIQNEEFQIKLVDVNGIVLQQKAYNSSIRFETKNLASGIYFINLQVDGKVKAIQKVVLEK